VFALEYERIMLLVLFLRSVVPLQPYFILQNPSLSLWQCCFYSGGERGARKVLLYLPESDADTIRLAGMVLVAMRWAGPWECVSSIGDVSIVAFGT